MKARIYHNPRCSKSRAALALLEEHGAAVEVIDYIANPLSRAELAALLKKLDGDALDLVRRDDPELAKRAAAAPDKIPDLLAENPRALQRPIVEVGRRAVIGRPPERVLELIE